MGAFDSELYALGYRFNSSNQEESSKEYWKKKGFFVTYQVDGDSYHALQRTEEFPSFEEALNLFNEKEKQLKGVSLTSRGTNGQIIYHRKVVYDCARFDAFHKMYKKP